MTQKVIKRRYIGRLEVFALKEEIQALLNAGHTYISIFQKFNDEQKLSICYRQFCRCLSQYCEIKVRNNKKRVTEKDKNQHSMDTTIKNKQSISSKNTKSYRKTPIEFGNYKPDIKDII